VAFFVTVGEFSTKLHLFLVNRIGIEALEEIRAKAAAASSH
jgi:hypothetical protein